jgi:hypothetical protein
VPQKDVLWRYHRGTHNILHNDVPCSDIVQMYAAETFAKRLFASEAEETELTIKNQAHWAALVVAGEKDGTDRSHE